MVYFDKILYAYVFEHFPATGMQNGDEVSPSNIFGWSRSFSENAHKSGPHGIFFSNFIYICILALSSNWYAKR